MKPTKKMLFIIAGAVAALGIILTSISIIMVKGNFRLLSTEGPYEARSYETQAAGIHELTLNSSDTKVNIVRSPDDKIHLNYYDKDKEKYTIGVSDGRLSINLTSSKKWYDCIGVNMDFYSDSTFQLAVPDNMTCNFSINTSNEKISADGISENGSFSLKTSNGSIDLSNITATGSLQSTTSDGEISAKEVSASGISLHSNMGKLTLSDLASKKEIDAEASDKVQISNISVETALKIRSVNGSINGTIDDTIRNFNIVSHTSDGDDNLPASLTGGRKALDVKTSDGNIHISFNDK